MPQYPKFSSVGQRMRMRMAVIRLPEGLARTALSFNDKQRLSYCLVYGKELKHKGFFIKYARIREVRNRDLLEWALYDENGKLLLGELIEPLQNAEEKSNFGGCYLTELNENEVKHLLHHEGVQINALYMKAKGFTQEEFDKRPPLTF